MYQVWSGFAFGDLPLFQGKIVGLFQYLAAIWFFGTQTIGYKF
jgi:hypothetical protein